MTVVLRRMRESSELTMRQVGGMIGISHVAISQFENQKLSLPDYRIEQLVKAYGYTMANTHQEAANKKKFGRKIKITEVIEFALSLVQQEHIKLLQDRSLTNEDRKEQIRQIYIEKIGPITKEEFTGFMMTDEFVEFRKAQVSQEKTDKTPLCHPDYKPVTQAPHPPNK